MPDEPPAPQGASDAELLSRIGARESGAFDVLYGRYARSVFGLALRLLGDRGDAEDAVEEAFTAIWRSASTYRPDRDAAGRWVYAVARDAILGRPRRRGPTAETGADEPAEEPLAAWHAHRALEELQRRERELIELSYWSGMPQSEVAGYLGLPRETLETRTRGALERLAAALEGEQPGRAHELLLEAGPPPELPPQLASAPSDAIVPRRGRRMLKSRAFLLVAAALAVAIAGYALANQGSGGAPAVRTVALKGTAAAPNARAVLDLGAARQGSTPLTLDVVGLPKPPSHDVYEVFLLRPGKRKASCGTFTVSTSSRTVTVTLSAPFAPRSGDSWLVARETRGGKNATTVLRSR